MVTVDVDEGEGLQTPAAPADTERPPAPGPVDAGAGGPGRRADADRWTGRLSRLALAAVLGTLAVAAARAVGDGWVPVGDSALIAVRARDVLGGGPQPQLGLWASTSWSVGFNLNHPGPLLFQLLAVPVAALGVGAGSVAGAVAIEAGAVLGIYLAAHRRGGPLVAAAAMASAGVLCWSMGPAVLVEPWHATTVLLPFLCFAVLAWSVAAGDLACLPWLALTGSLVLQSNLSYAVLVPALAAGAVVALAVRWRRPASRPPRRRALAWGGAAVAVVAACWALPLHEQLTQGDDGNVARLARSTGRDVATLDGGEAVRVVAEVLAVPPWFARPSFADDFRLGVFGNPLPSLAVSGAALALLAALVAGALIDARRRRDPVAGGAGAVAAVLVGLALVTAAHSPTSVYGTIAYQLRWLWPIGAFVALALAVAAARRFASGAARARWWTGGFAGAALVAAVLGLPATGYGTTAAAGTGPVARELVEQVAAARLTGPLLVVCEEHVFDPYCEAVIAELRDEGVELLVEGDIETRQLGTARRWDGRAGAGQVRVVTGDYAVLPPPPGQRRIAVHRGLDRTEHLELFYLQEDLKAATAAGELRLNARGRRVAARGDLLSADAGARRPVLDAGRVVEMRPFLFGEHRRDLVVLATEGLLEPNPEWDRALDRYVELQRRWDEQTVAVFVGPLPDRQAPSG